MSSLLSCNDNLFNPDHDTSGNDDEFYKYPSIDTGDKSDAFFNVISTSKQFFVLLKTVRIPKHFKYKFLTHQNDEMAVLIEILQIIEILIEILINASRN